MDVISTGFGGRIVKSDFQRLIKTRLIGKHVALGPHTAWRFGPASGSGYGLKGFGAWARWQDPDNSLLCGVSFDLGLLLVIDTIFLRIQRRVKNEP